MKLEEAETGRPVSREVIAFARGKVGRGETEGLGGGESPINPRGEVAVVIIDHQTGPQKPSGASHSASPPQKASAAKLLEVGGHGNNGPLGLECGKGSGKLKAHIEGSSGTGRWNLVEGNWNFILNVPDVDINFTNVNNLNNLNNINVEYSQYWDCRVGPKEATKDGGEGGGTSSIGNRTRPGWTGLRVAGVNVRSIRKDKAIHFAKILTQESFDVILVNETWLNMEYSSVNRNYTVHQNNHPSGYKGTMVLVKKPVKAYSLPRLGPNSCLVKLITEKGRHMFVMSLYFPPERNEWNEAYEEMKETLRFLKEKYVRYSLLIFADVNRDLRNKRAEEKFLALGVNPDLSDLRIHFNPERDAHTREGVREGERCNSYIDYFMSVNLGLSEVQIGGGVFPGSDHHLISAKVVKGMYLSLRTRKVVNQKQIKANLESIRKVLVKSIQPGREVAGIREVYDHIRAIHKPVYLRTKPMRLGEGSIFGKDLEKMTAKDIREHRRREYESYLHKVVENRESGLMKEFHRKVQGILKLGTSGGIDLLEVEGQGVLHDHTEIENEIMRHYRNIFGGGRESKAVIPHGGLGEVSREEIRKAMERVSRNKALSHDLLPDTVFDPKCESIVDAMTLLVNSCFREVYIPDEAATSRLHVVNKDKNSTPNLKNLRPIMINSPLRKLMEALLLPELQTKLIEGKVLDQSQTGFIPGCGTSINLVKSLADIIGIKGRKSAKGKYYVVFVDFKAAFDSVNHGLLYEKLERAGIEETTVNRVKFLYNNAYFKHGGGSKAPINVGVHQGSLTSPLLFNLYINDLLKELGQLLGTNNVYCYADDLMFVVLGKDFVRKALAKVRDWGELNAMGVNLKKCGIIKIKNRGKEVIKVREIGGIDVVDQYRYLGVTLDSLLTLQPYMDQLAKRMKIVYSSFYKLISTAVGVKLKLEVWKVYVKTIMEYGAEVFALVPGKIDKFRKLYYKTLKVSLGLPWNTSNTKLIKSLGIMDAETIVNLKLLHTHRKIVRRGLKVPGVLSDRVGGLLRGLVLDDLDQPEDLRGAMAYTRSKLQELWGLQDKDLNYPEGLFIIKDDGDWDMLHAMVGRLIHGLYKRESCEMCGEERSQAHILNTCVKHIESRRVYKKKLCGLGLRLDNEMDLEKWIYGIQVNEEIHSLGSSERELLLVASKVFLKEVRSAYKS